MKKTLKFLLGHHSYATVIVIWVRVKGQETFKKQLRSEGFFCFVLVLFF
jgi:hypothetical protein